MSWRSTRARPAPARSSSIGPAQPCASSQRELEQHYPQARLGRARSRGDLAGHARGRPRRARRGRPRPPPRSRRSASPTSARPWCSGSARAAGRSTRRSSGRTGAPRRAAGSCEADGLDPLVQERTGLLIDPYFSATKLAWLLDEVAGARAAAERGELAFGTDRQLSALAADRRPGARDRRDQRLAHHALRHPPPGLGRRPAAPARHPARAAARGQGLQRAVRHHARRAVRRAAAGHRDRRRPAGGDRRPGLLRARHAQEHLRHRLLRPAQHRRARGAPRSNRLLTTIAYRLGGQHHLRARGQHLRRRRGGAVAARRPAA